MEFVKPLTVQLKSEEVQLPTTGAEDDRLVRTLAVYEVTGELPSESGANQEIAMVPLPRIVVTVRGAPGSEPGVRASRSDAVPSPTLLVAKTEM